jgi:hypothetical protein
LVGGGVGGWEGGRGGALRMGGGRGVQHFTHRLRQPVAVLSMWDCLHYCMPGVYQVGARRTPKW